MPPPTACVRLHRLRGRGRGSRMARWEATVHRSRRSMYATVLWFLLFLFCLRVAGQALVAAFAVPFLPPMQQWYSGVMPYPILLPVQILDRKSTRLNSSHGYISYAVFCLKKKKYTDPPRSSDT